MTFTRSVNMGTSPAAFNASRSMTPEVTFSSSFRRTSARLALILERKPNFGRRRASVVCPPSKPTLWYPPFLARWPLTPRPQVLPWPADAPRPTRSRARLAPEPGFKVLSLMTLGLFHSQEMLRNLDHAAILRRVGNRHALMALAQAEPTHGRCDVPKLPVNAL